jgi:hypothetical protein
MRTVKNRSSQNFSFEKSGADEQQSDDPTPPNVYSIDLAPSLEPTEPRSGLCAARVGFEIAPHLSIQEASALLAAPPSVAMSRV